MKISSQLACRIPQYVCCHLGDVIRKLRNISCHHSYSVIDQHKNGICLLIHLWPHILSITFRLLITEQASMTLVSGDAIAMICPDCTHGTSWCRCFWVSTTRRGFVLTLWNTCTAAVTYYTIHTSRLISVTWYHTLSHHRWPSRISSSTELEHKMKR